MTDDELHAHRLFERLRYLLHRLEAEFFHIHPDLDTNGDTTSLVLSSILNEAVNLQEAALIKNEERFFTTLKKWANAQCWNWSDVEIRFTWGSVCKPLSPFKLNGKQLIIAGRDANNQVKHGGSLARLTDVITACAATWFLVLERIREVGIFIGEEQANQVVSLFDCYDWISIRSNSWGALTIDRPVTFLLSYPYVRGPSEIPLAERAFETRAKRARSKSESDSR